MGIRRALAGAVLGLAGSTLLALPAAAVVPDPYGPPPGGGGGSLSTSTTTVVAGGTVIISGTGFAANSTVAIAATVVNQGFAGTAVDAGPAPMGSLLAAGQTRAAAPAGWAAAPCINACTVTANAVGSFSIALTLTQVGTNLITATGVGSNGEPLVLSVTVLVTAAGGIGDDDSGAGGGDDNAGGVGLPDTGADLRMPVLLGGLLILLGGGAAVLGRWRGKRSGAAAA